MLRLWEKVIAFLKKILGIKTIPQEVADADTLVTNWWDIYSSKASWLPYKFVTSDGRSRSHTRRTLNPAKIVCSEIAGLVLAEPPTVDAGPLVESVIKAESLWSNLRRHVEYQAAMGGMAIKARPENGKIVLDFVTALNIIPIKADNSRIVEASFIDRRVDGKKVYVRIESYTKTDTGYRVQSRAFDEAKDEEVPLEKLWPGVLPSVEIEIDDPPFVYMKNPEANNIDSESPIGISAFHNADDMIQGLDIAYDEFVWEVESGQRRIAVPAAAMRTFLDLETGQNKLGYNPGDRVFMTLVGDDADKLKMTDLTSDIRAQQFIDVINYNLNLLSVQCGFDAGYFSFDGTSMKTATEVISENSHTYKTREAYREVLNTGLIQLFRVINKLGAIYKIEGTTTKEPSITWNDGIIEDRNSRTKYHEDLFASGLEDRVTAIMKIHGLDEAKAQEMAKKIKADKAIVADPFGFDSEPKKKAYRSPPSAVEKRMVGKISDVKVK